MTFSCRFCKDTFNTSVWRDADAWLKYHLIACALDDDSLYYHITEQEQDA